MITARSLAVAAAVLLAVVAAIVAMAAVTIGVARADTPTASTRMQDSSPTAVQRAGQPGLDAHAAREVLTDHFAGLVEALQQPAQPIPAQDVTAYAGAYAARIGDGHIAVSNVPLATGADSRHPQPSQTHAALAVLPGRYRR